MPKIIRFAAVVARFGAPEPFLLWVKPEKDPAFMKAVKERKVMTVHPELHGGKKDFATADFQPDTRAQYLLFPKTLGKIAGLRVVGIDYGLLKRPAPFEGSNKKGSGSPPRLRSAPPRVLSTKSLEKISAPPKIDLAPAVAAEIRTVLADMRQGRNKQARARLAALID